MNKKNGTYIIILLFLSIFSIKTHGITNIVNLSNGASYTSNDLYQMALQLESNYPEIIHVEIIGKSVDQKPLYSIIMTKDVNQIRLRDDFNVLRQHYFIEAGTHARETVNPIIVMKQIEDYAIDFMQDNYIPDFNVSQELEDVAIHFLPLTNPDGYDLVKFGQTSVQTQEALIQLNKVNTQNYQEFKAGITGVDHNRNYPQEYYDVSQNKWINLWQKNPNSFYASEPSSAFYPGPYPASEPEVQAVMNYILSYDFRNYISFHSRGNIIYWNKYYAPDFYNQHTYQLAQSLSQVTGYSVSDPDNGKGSGYISDFTSSQTLKPLVTVETLSAKTTLPTPNDLYLEAYQKNQLVPLYAIQEGKKLGYHPYRLYVDFTYIRDFANLTYANAFAEKYNGEIIEGKGVPPMYLEKKKRVHRIYELLEKYLPLI